MPNHPEAPDTFWIKNQFELVKISSFEYKNNDFRF